MTRATSVVLILALFSNQSFAATSGSLLELNEAESIQILDQTLARLKGATNCSELLKVVKSQGAVRSEVQTLLQNGCAQAGATALPKMTRSGTEIRIATEGGTSIYFKFIDFAKGIVEINRERVDLHVPGVADQLKRIQDALPSHFSGSSPFDYMIHDAYANPVALIALVGILVWMAYCVAHGFWASHVYYRGKMACEKVKSDPLMVLGPKNREEQEALVRLQQSLVEAEQYAKDDWLGITPESSALQNCVRDVRMRVSQLLTPPEAADPTGAAAPAK